MATTFSGLSRDMTSRSMGSNAQNFDQSFVGMGAWALDGFSCLHCVARTPEPGQVNSRRPIGYRVSLKLQLSEHGEVRKQASTVTFCVPFLLLVSRFSSDAEKPKNPRFSFFSCSRFASRDLAGYGSFGGVFRGIQKDGTEVAIKARANTAVEQRQSREGVRGLLNSEQQRIRIY